MKIGSLVECIQEIDKHLIAPDCRERPNPVKGQIYTVSFVDIAFLFHGPVLYICLSELHEDSCFNAIYFREIQPPMDVSIESIISETVEA